MKLEEIYTRLTNSQKEIRDIRKMFKDELLHSSRYQEIQEEMKALRDERKMIENEIKANPASKRAVTIRTSGSVRDRYIEHIST